jgi:uncharacterized protein YlxW (UPF0749 family)
VAEKSFPHWMVYLGLVLCIACLVAALVFNKNNSNRSALEAENSLAAMREEYIRLQASDSELRTTIERYEQERRAENERAIEAILFNQLQTEYGSLSNSIRQLEKQSEDFRIERDAAIGTAATLLIVWLVREAGHALGWW